MVVIPPKVRTYCPKCKAYTEHRVSIVRPKQRGGGKSKGQRRAERNTKGYGNKGRYSRRPNSQRKMKSKTTQKIDMRLECAQCKRKLVRSRPRARKVEMGKL